MKMKLLPLFLLFFLILLTHAQRRTTVKPSTEAETTKATPPRGRGRSRFVSSAEYQNVKDSSSTPDPTTRKTVASRRRVTENVEQRFPSRSTITATTTKQPLTVDPSVERRTLTPTFTDTVEKIFTVNENVNRRPARPLSSISTPLFSENVGRRAPKPLTDYVERRNFKSNKNTYEVQEIINDDFELVRRSKKPRVLTENSYKATNLPARNQGNTELFKSTNFPKRKQESTELFKSTKRYQDTSELTKSTSFPKRNKDTQELSKTSDKSPKNLVTAETPATLAPMNDNGDTNLLEEQTPDTTLPPSDLEVPADPLPENEAKEDRPKPQPVSSTAKSTEAPKIQGSRRNAIRKSTTIASEQTTSAPRFRTRGRPNKATQIAQEAKAPEFYFQAVMSTSAPGRGFRRRQDTLVEPRNGPSVFTADTQFQENRSRRGRKIESPEKIRIDIPTKNHRRTTTPKTRKSSSLPTFPSRNSFRSREMPIIDEQKLEVLPLFEEEPKLIHTRVTNRADNLDYRSRKRGSFREKPTIDKKDELDARSRRRGGLDMMQTSATVTEKTFAKTTEIPGRSRVTVSVSMETRTESSYKRATPIRKTDVKESVTSEINEVTSRRKVPRKKVTLPNRSNDTKEKNIVGQVVPSYRGSKKSQVVIKKDSSEEIGDSDNYPEPFKALIKAKKDKKESRSSASSLTFPRSTNVVTSVPSSSTTAYPLTTKEINGNNNELESKPSTTHSPSRRSRTRVTYPSSTKNIKERRFNSKTTLYTTPSTTPLTRGTKFRTLTPRTYSPSPKLERTVSFKPRSNENSDEVKRFNRGRNVKKPENPILLPTKVPKSFTTSKKLDRGKYRSEFSSRGSTTTPPKYIPTIPSVPYVPTVPTITPPRTMVDTTPNQIDDDVGLQVISIDEPVNAIPSANLVNGDYVSSTANSVSVPLPLVRDGSTEKSVSIIERIINSISTISTTPPSKDILSSSTVSTTESPSAILKISPKKSRQTDFTDVTKQTYPNGTIILTTENPTTIIEKILSSLNAIQATDNTTSVQVGTDFNTLSSFTTTPLPSVTKSSTIRSLLAPSSTTVIPLSILDGITPEELLQQQAISRLLDILNGLVSSPQPDDLVVVTPKSVNKQTGRGPFISSTIVPPSIYSSEFTTAPKLSTLPFFGTESIYSNLIFSEAPTIVSTEIISTAPSFSETPSASESTTLDVSSSETISNEAPLFTSPESISSTQLVSTDSTTGSKESDVTTVTSEENSTSSITTESQINSTTENYTAESTTSIPTASDAGTTITEAINFFTVLSTLPSLQQFEVSPGSVSIFSANDISSNSITLEDNISTTSTVNIAGRSNFDNTATTQSTTTEGTTLETTPFEVTTVASVESSSGPMGSSTSSVNNTQTNSTRSGKLLNFVQDPVQNTIDTSTPDYFIFAVLNNNTILRKRPLVEPKASFYVVGVYPNNTVVKKYPNGTIVPMDMIIRVRGFDTRENPPPLPEITSNQVTSDPGSSLDNKIVKTVEQNNIPSVEANPLSVAPSTTTTPKPANIPYTQAQSSTTQLMTTTPAPTSSTTAQSSTALPTTTTLAPPTKAQSSITTAPAPSSSSKSNTASFQPQELTTLSTTDPEGTILTSTEVISTIAQNMSEASTVMDMVTVESSTVIGTTMGSNSIPPTFPTLSELFNGKTIEAFNEIVNSDQTNTNTSNRTENGRENKYLKVLNIQDLIKGRNADTSSRREPNSNKVDTTTPLSSVNATSTSTSPTLQSSVITETTTDRTEVTPMKVDASNSEESIFFSNQIFEDLAVPQVVTPFSAIQKIGTTKSPRPTTVVPTTNSQPNWVLTSTPPSIHPTFLTTFFPNLFNTETTKIPKLSREPGVIRISAAPSVTETVTIPTTIRSATTTTSLPITTTRPFTTTKRNITTTEQTTTERATKTARPTASTRSTTTTRLTTTRVTTTTTRPITTTILPSEPLQTKTDSTTGRTITVTDFNTIEFTTKALKLKELSKEQKQNLKVIAQLEKEQAALLQQLSFLTNLGTGTNRGAKSTPINGNRNPDSSSSTNLAERIVALAVQRDKAAKTTTAADATITTSGTTKSPNSIQDQLAALDTTRTPKKATPALNEVLKQYNLNGLNVAGTAPTSTVYGKSEDAILASILKEQGIVPSTPKVLAGIFDETTSRPRFRTTTPPPGPLMRGLNWLLNALAPTPPPVVTKRPTTKPVKPKKPPVEEELLVNSPTHTTPVVTHAPSKVANSLSQDDVQKLIKQLEGIQKDPSKGSLDLSHIKSIQNLINSNEGIVVSANGEHGSTSRRTTTLPTTIQTQTTQRQPRKLAILSTEDPILSVSNSFEEDSESIEVTTRTLRAPIGFNPVPGVDDDNNNNNPLVRSNLITAAVNVTRAISSFLGTALQTVSQGAAASFQTLFGVSSLGTRLLAGGSSAG